MSKKPPRKPSPSARPKEQAVKPRAAKLQFDPATSYAVLGAAALYLLLRIGAVLVFAPGDRVWGLDYMRYILTWDVWLALVLPLTACLPPVARAIAQVFHSANEQKSHVKYYAVGLVLTAVLFALASEYQVAYSFLGDGSYCHAEVYRVDVDPGMESQLFDKPTAFGTGQVLRAIATGMELTDYRYPFLLLSYAGIFLLIPGLFVFLRDEPRPVAALFIAAILGTPAALFFFGYIELYTVQYAFLGLFFAASYRSLKHNKPVYLPLALLVLSVVFGGSSLIYFPAAMFLAAAHRITSSHRPRRAVGGLIMLSVLVFVALMLLQWDDMRSPYLIPLVSGDITRADGIMTGWFGYSMFSWAHLADMLNTLLFNGGVVLVTGLVGILFMRGKTLESLPVQFGAVAAVAGALLLLGGNASFGLARDWDLAVIPTLGLLFFAAAALSSLHEQRRIALQMLLPAILLTGAGTVYMWVGLNHSPVSAQRLEDIIEMDDDLVQPIITYTGYENLRKYYTMEKLDDKRAAILKKMIATGWHIDVLYNEGITTAVFFDDETRQQRELDWYFSHLIERLKQDYPENHYRHIPKARLNEMIAGLLLFMQPDKPGYTVRYNELVHRGVPEWPYYEFVKLATDDSVPMNAKHLHTDGMVPLTAEDPILLARMGDFYSFGQQYRAALQYFERSLEESPHDYPNVYMTVAGIQAGVFGRPDSAIATLERGIGNCRLSPQLPALEGMLQEIRRRMETQ